MILLEENNKLEEFEVIESKDLSISTDSNKYIFKILIKNYYSKNIESIVREIVSNCYDANVESGSNKPILITLNDDFISFKDNGIGISEERMIVYSSLFSSTKRKSNEFHGSFGLGSKTPLSYADYYYINTINNGFEYRYICSFIEDEPKIDLLFKEKTYKESGTEIVVDLINKTGYYTKDFNKFLDAIDKQLTFFDSIYVDNAFFVNNYKIYDCKTYLYNNQSKNVLLRAVHGKAVYDIDFKYLGINEIQIPVGLKFSIGELMVNPNRESLLLNEHNKKKLLDKINDFKIEIKEQFLNQNNVIEDFFVFLDSWSLNKTIKYQDNDQLVVNSIVNNNVKYKKDFNFEYYPSVKVLCDFLFNIYEVKDGKSKIQKYPVFDNDTNIYFCKKQDSITNKYIENGLLLIPKKNNYNKWISFLKIKNTDLGVAKKIVEFKDYSINKFKERYLKYPELNKFQILATKQSNKKPKLEKSLFLECYDINKNKIKIDLSKDKYVRYYYLMLKEDDSHAYNVNKIILANQIQNIRIVILKKENLKQINDSFFEFNKIKENTQIKKVSSNYFQYHNISYSFDSFYNRNLYVNRLKSILKIKLSINYDLVSKIYKFINYDLYLYQSNDLMNFSYEIRKHIEKNEFIEILKDRKQLFKKAKEILTIKQFKIFNK